MPNRSRWFIKVEKGNVWGFQIKWMSQEPLLKNKTKNIKAAAEKSSLSTSSNNHKGFLV